MSAKETAPGVLSRTRLTAALAAQKAGRIEDAERTYRAVIEEDPDNADAIHLLGVVVLERGSPQTAIELFRRAIAINDDTMAYHGSLANALLQAGMLPEAIAEYGRAIELKPNHALTHSNLGNAFRAAGDLKRAVDSYRQACDLDPKFAVAWNNLGVALTEARQLEQAIAALRLALQLKANYPEALNNLGNAYQEAGNTDYAIQCFERVLEMAPDNAGAYNNLAIVLQENGRIEEAIGHYRRALALRPDYPDALNNLGTLLLDEIRLDEAIDYFRKALRLRPNYPAAQANCAHALLMRGEFAEGWKLYEHRWDGSKDARGAKRKIARPQWDGGTLSGQTILLHAEQGLGDTIQFVRYVPQVAARGARVILECHPELTPLLGCVDGVAQVIARGDPVPDCDVHCPLLSLPLAFSTDLGSVPADVPYLRAPAAAVLRFGQRFTDDDALRVGLVWRGEPRNRNDHKRSVALSELAPLAGLAGVRFYSLQMGAGKAETSRPPGGIELIDLTAEIKDFADTAALVEHLDLIISVDTGVAHLAGALGKPVWLLCRYESEWRWMLEREDSPWYPTLRIFRQDAPRNWASVIGRVKQALAATVDKPVDDAETVRASAAAASLFERSRLAEGERILRAALGRNPRNGRLLSDLSVIAARRRRHELALVSCDRALAFEPSLATAHFNRGNALRDLGRPAAAMTCYQRALELRPDYTKALNNFGLVLIGLGRMDEARDCFIRALELFPTFAEAHINLGRVFRERAMYGHAEQCFRRALALRPDLSAVLKNDAPAGGKART
jgi:tetratricopeptide (TPR) repeat protein